MFIGQLNFVEKTPVDGDAASNALDFFLSALRMNGQACGREFPCAVTPSGYTATVLLPERTSLNAVHRNRYVRLGLETLREIGFAEPECVVVESLDGAGTCSCENPSGYVLFTNYVSLEAPLRCADCFLPVPLYRIPATINDEYYDIITWQSYYQACDTLQMNCTPIERTAMRELSCWDSGLSKHGSRVCQRIFELTQKPTYSYLFQWRARSVRQEKKRLCPSCHDEWLLPEPWHEKFDFKCDRCHLLSNIAKEFGR